MITLLQNYYLYKTATFIFTKRAVKVKRNFELKKIIFGIDKTQNIITANVRLMTRSAKTKWGKQQNCFHDVIRQLQTAEWQEEFSEGPEMCSAWMHLLLEGIWQLIKELQLLSFTHSMKEFRAQSFPIQRVSHDYRTDTVSGGIAKIVAFIKI